MYIQCSRLSVEPALVETRCPAEKIRWWKHREPQRSCTWGQHSFWDTDALRSGEAGQRPRALPCSRRNASREAPWELTSVPRRRTKQARLPPNDPTHAQETSVVVVEDSHHASQERTSQIRRRELAGPYAFGVLDLERGAERGPPKSSPSDGVPGHITKFYDPGFGCYRTCNLSRNL